ncbi:hypothetical protein K2173_002295 [Erythroxylum novogranatense]|uniref:Expp1 protein n=1 Tax=Erythroxylum novogranatense TaxID=1862640 RepID=A0AAV8T9R1_9ROSI|nr:hypothetical protein K2173_002295 [Erythroxylum novogranatense]
MQSMKNIWITEKMVMVVLMTMIASKASDTNDVYDPCLDASVQKWDGFTFGLAFANKESFFSNQVQFSPCDSRLGLTGGTAQVAIFRPKVDELFLLTTNGTSPVEGGAYMVAFAGRKYAARSVPILISDSTMTIKSFTLVLEFQKGTLQNLYWKKFGCKSCSKDMVCFNGQDCAVPNSKCTSNGGIVDCGVRVQLAFSGTDKNLEALNSWYEVSNLRQYSLYGLYSDLRDSIFGLGKIFLLDFLKKERKKDNRNQIFT